MADTDATGSLSPSSGLKALPATSTHITETPTEELRDDKGKGPQTNELVAHVSRGKTTALSKPALVIYACKCSEGRHKTQIHELVLTHNLQVRQRRSCVRV